MFALFLAFALLPFGMASALEGRSSAQEKGETGDPFSLMYDSEKRLSEEIRELPELMFEQEVAEEEKGELGTLRSFTALQEEMGVNQVKLNQAMVASLIERDGLPALDRFDLLEETKEYILFLEEELKTARYLVKYHSDSSQSVIEGREGTASQIGENVELVTLTEKVNPMEFADELKADGMQREIEYIQPDFLMEYAEASLSYINDEGVEESSSENEKEEVAEEPEIEEEIISDEEEMTEELLEEIVVSEEPVIIALLDTGIDATHSIFEKISDEGDAYSVLLTGRNFVTDTDVIYDENYPLASAHGTHIAGIIAENSNENIRILPLQVFGNQGAYTSDIIEAIQYAEEQGAKIVNCSFGSKGYNPALLEAMEDSSMLFVAAVGNERSDLGEAPVYPAAFSIDNVISVASLNGDGGFSYYSNYSSDMIDIAARGKDVESSLPQEKYGNMSGSSMAAGFVSATAGMLQSIEEDMIASEIKERLVATGDRLSHLENKVRDGRRLNASMAYQGEEQTGVREISYEDDFDVHGLQRTPEESYALFSSRQLTQVVSGGGDFYGLCNDGTVWKLSGSSIEQIIGLGNVVSLKEAKSNMSPGCAAIKSDGTLWIIDAISLPFGSSNGIPVQVTGLTDIMDATLGGFTCSYAVDTDGNVWGWGYNNKNYLLNDTITDGLISVPVKVNVENVASITLGGSFPHIITVQENADLYTWGHNLYWTVPHMADGNTRDMYLYSLTEKTGVSNAKAVQTGDRYAMVLLNNGTIKTWNHYSRVYSVAGLANIRQIAGSDSGYMYALSNDGLVYKVYDGGYYVQIPISNVISLSVNGGIVALKDDGTVWTWNDSTRIPTQIMVNLGGNVVSLTLNVTEGNVYYINVAEKQAVDLAERGYTFSYDTQMLQLADGCALTYEKEVDISSINAAGVAITSISQGSFGFSVNKVIPEGKKYSGAVNVIAVKALATGETTVTLEY